MCQFWDAVKSGFRKFAIMARNTNWYDALTISSRTSNTCGYCPDGSLYLPVIPKHLRDLGDCRLAGLFIGGGIRDEDGDGHVFAIR